MINCNLCPDKQGINYNNYRFDNRSYIKIAKELNVNEKTVRRNFKILGIKKLRSNGNIKNIKYMHEWVRKNKPKPVWCEECFSRKPFDLANISGEYKLDINDFRWLCRKCHMISDGRINFQESRFGKQIRDSKGRFIA